MPRRTWRTVAAVIGAVFITLFGVRQALRHFPGPPHLKFLSGRPVMFKVNPGLGGLVGFAYSYRGHSATAMLAADKELVSAGFIKTTIRASAADYERGVMGRADWMDVYVAEYRITGKHFEFDADILDGYRDPDWVTVEVAVADPLDPHVRRWIGIDWN